jgi:hypothetical protein
MMTNIFIHKVKTTTVDLQHNYSIPFSIAPSYIYLRSVQDMATFLNLGLDWR